MPRGVVSGVFGARCQVLEAGAHGVGEREIPCFLRGRFKQVGEACPIVVGDDVEYRMVDPQQGVIEQVRERRSELRRYGGERQRRRKQGGSQVMLANADQAVFVAAAREPGIDFLLIDRALATARACGLSPALCINKMDLADPEAIRRIVAPYERMGMPVVYASAAQGDGLEELQRLLAGKISIFWGGSGVGKSSLIRALTGREIQVGVWNPENPRGPHTTANARLYPLPDGGILADTPGFDMLLLAPEIEVTPPEEALLPEAAPLAVQCRFPNCTHRGEAGCAVQAAVLSGAMDAGRYSRFLTLAGPAVEVDAEGKPSEVVSVGGELFRRLVEDDREQFIETWNGLGKTAWCYFWPFVRGYGIDGEREVVWKEIEDALCAFVRLTGRGQDQLQMLFPPLGADQGAAMHECIRLLRRLNPEGRAKVMWVDEEDAPALRSLRGIRLRTKNDEYWYRPAELLALEGPRFGRLRRELRRLHRDHTVTARPYQIEDLPACLAVLRHWNETQGQHYPAVLDSAYAETALRTFEDYSWEDLTGVVAEVDGEIRAFAFGGRHSARLGHAYLLKADLQLPNLSAYTFLELLRQMSDYEWVNSGGDLRQTGLARWKQRLHPGQQRPVFQAVVR
jgi:ribosome biogenesis GTPase / thiamine phosphate phosphatase